ncbi:MAG TPA: hypothetical protein VJ992_09665 [Gemmatimonadales bacterium]|nr:hypothetical protein [Gemmatimonadales bacterium]
MRHSTALLGESTVRLSDLRFPASRVHIARTRLAYIHIDNLLHFAKIDRDGRIDGYVAAYLPDEVALLFFQRGEVISAAALTAAGRQILPIGTALKRMHDELERGELVFCEAPFEQIAWMYESCLEHATRRPVVTSEPPLLFRALKHEGYTGVLELIADGQVSYFRLAEGRYASGHFSDKPDDLAVPAYVEGMFKPRPDGTPPRIVAHVFPTRAAIPVQAAPSLIESYRELYHRFAASAEARVPGEAIRRGNKIRDALVPTHAALAAISAPQETEPEPLVATPEELTAALGDWALQLLDQLEIIAPGIAPDVLVEATREQRFMLQKAGLYDRFPWPVHW